MKSYKKRHKRHFVLLEILIAFFLVALCIFPLIQSNVAVLKSEKALNLKLRTERDCNLIFAKLVEKFYKNEITTALIDSQKPANLKDLGFLEAGTLTFEIEKKKERDDKTFNILKITLHLDNQSYQKNYYLFYERKTPPKARDT